jgi:hypothetical protein
MYREEGRTAKLYIISLAAGKEHRHRRKDRL